MDKGKHLEPLFSQSVGELAMFMITHKEELLNGDKNSLGSPSIFKYNNEGSLISGLNLSDDQND